MDCNFGKELKDIKESIYKLEKEVNRIAKLPIIQEALDKQVSESRINYTRALNEHVKRMDEIHTMFLDLDKHLKER